MKRVESIPNATRTFKALRSLGYSLESSISDIIDNSISAASDEIRIVFQRKKNKFICRILDNGMGMDAKLLEECMRIGTETAYGEHSLGKFGMGMKTASLSHCDRLSVLSKKRNSEEACFIWDMEHVRGVKSWELLQLTDKEIINFFKKEKMHMPANGTLVCWDGMFLLDAEYNLYRSEKKADNFYYRILGNLKMHLSTVFHKYLEENDICSNISIYVNDEKLKPWDPFCKSEEATEEIKLSENLSIVEIERRKKPVIIKGYVLPAEKQFSSEQSWKNAKGLLPWNDAQGYYVYRNHRLIRFGGWHNTKAKDEHYKLARISIDIDSSLDDYFRITVNKNKVQFPEILFQHLKNKVNMIIVNKAEKRYRNAGEKKGPTISTPPRRPKGKYSEDQGDGKGGTKVEEQYSKEDFFYRVCQKGNHEIVLKRLSSYQLWEVEWKDNKKLVVYLNRNHNFYREVYFKKKDKEALNMIIFSLAFAETYHRGSSMSYLLDEFKETFSDVLERSINKIR